MMIRDEQAWADYQASNPVPRWGPDPTSWPTDWNFSIDPEDVAGDAYGYTVLIFAERWADRMELAMGQHPSVTVAACAKQAATDADKSLGQWGITGFQYGSAVSILATVWEHGEELRVWHNLDTQLGDEGERANRSGGVLNPAVMKASSDDE